MREENMKKYKLSVLLFGVMVILTSFLATALGPWTPIPVPPVRYLWDYDDFSSGSFLDPSKWTEMQDPEGWPLMGQYYVDTQEGRYHTQSVGSNDQRVVLHLTGHKFRVGDTLDYDVYYNAQQDVNGIFVYLNGGPTYRLSTCPETSILPFDPLGIYHYTIAFKSTHIELTKIYPNNSRSTCNLPINQQWNYGGRTWSSTPPWTIGIESYKGGSPSTSFIHADFDNFIISG